jgi:hypothetical protein
MGGKMSLKEALDEALKLEAVKAADGPPAKLQEIRGGASMRIWSPAT